MTIVEKKCPKCNSIYSCVSYDVLKESKKSIDCIVCGAELFTWEDNHKMWLIKLVEKVLPNKPPF